MPVFGTFGIVLGSSPFKEQDKLVYLLTKEKGIIKGIAPGACKVKNRFGSLFELFTVGEFQIYHKEDKDLVTFSKGEVTQSFFNTVSRAENIFYFYVIAEVLLKFIPYHHRDKRIYRLVYAILDHSAKGIALKSLFLYFLIWILRVEGMMFNPGICYNCFEKSGTTAWVKADYRGILCSRCRSNETVSLKEAELKIIRWTEKHSPQDVTQLDSQFDFAGLIRILLRKIEYHGEFSLTSLQYLPEFK